MQSINKKRAEMLTPIFRNPENEEDNTVHLDCQFTVNALAAQLLAGTISCKEAEAPCGTPDCPYAPKSSVRPMLTLHTSLRPDFTNLVEAIEANYRDAFCQDCQKELVVTREFGQFIFFEVQTFVILLIQIWLIS